MKPAAAPNLLLAQRAASPEPSRSDASIAHRPFVERGRSETAPLHEGAGGSGEIAPLPIGGRGGGGRNEPRFRVKSRQRRMLALIGAVCAAPVLASYLAYYMLQPAGRTNYGALVEPQRPTPPLALHALDGTSYPAAALRGRWVMLQVAGGACDGDCRHQLWIQRQVRLTTGRERERVQRVWLVTDAAPVDPQLLREHAGLLVLRADPAQLAAFLPLAMTGAGGQAGSPGAAKANDRAPGSQAPADLLSDHIWLVDPLGNLMLRWPAAADPQRMKRDLNRLLAASSVG